MQTASIDSLRRARDGVTLILATCDECGRSVLHGLGGDTLDQLAADGSSRVAHCGCGVYVLTDTHRIVAEAAARGSITAPRPGVTDATAALILDRLAEGPETQLALANYRGQGHAFKVLNQLVARGEVVAATVRGRTVYTLPARG